jgi:hypothetical protein
MQARLYAALKAGLVSVSLPTLRGLGGPVAGATHLGRTIIGIVYFNDPRYHRLEFRYRLMESRTERLRRRLSVREGGRSGWENRLQ